MSALEEDVIPKLRDYLVYWKRYVDDTHAYINPDKLNIILDALNSYHPKIKFTYELEKEGKLSFLDVLIIR